MFNNNQVCYSTTKKSSLITFYFFKCWICECCILSNNYVSADVKIDQYVTGCICLCQNIWQYTLISQFNVTMLTSLCFVGMFLYFYAPICIAQQRMNEDRWESKKSWKPAIGKTFVFNIFAPALKYNGTSKLLVLFVDIMSIYIILSNLPKINKQLISPVGSYIQGYNYWK